VRKQNTASLSLTCVPDIHRLGWKVRAGKTETGLLLAPYEQFFLKKKWIRELSVQAWADAATGEHPREPAQACSLTAMLASRAPKGWVVPTSFGLGKTPILLLVMETN